MVYYLAFGIKTTTSKTWIDTFLIHTRSSKGTFQTDHTFWSTSRWASRITWDTRTHCLSIYFFALRVRSAWRRIARILRNVICRKKSLNFWSVIKYWILTRNSITRDESISCWTLTTRTNRNMVQNWTFSVLSTCSRTRIFTFIPYACLVERTIII